MDSLQANLKAQIWLIFGEISQIQTPSKLVEINVSIQIVKQLIVIHILIIVLGMSQQQTGLFDSPLNSVLSHV
jgi:hypothetical protein